MSETSGWLPELIFYSEYGGDWQAYLEALYGIYRRDFITSQPISLGKRWAIKRAPVYDGKPATFWHLISEGAQEAARTPDFRRCERIAWPRAMIDAFRTDKITWWRTTRKRETRLLISLPDFSYVVVLAERTDSILLWTAFCVKDEHRRRKLRKEWETYNRIKS